MNDIAKTDLIIPGLPKDFEHVVASVQGREASEECDMKLAEGELVEDLFSSSSITVPHPSRKTTDLLPAFEQGHLLDQKGIYLGVWCPKDHMGKDLGKVFDVYAAPTDLTAVRSTLGNRLHTHFKEAVNAVAALKDWHHHNGIRIDSDKVLWSMIQENRFRELGNWFIPPKELLFPGNIKLKDAPGPNLYDCKDKKAFKNSFLTNYAGGMHCHWYWSITESANNRGNVYLVDFRDKVAQDFPKDKDTIKASTRPIRLELRL